MYLGHEGKQDRLAPAAAKLSGQKIEEKEERRLTSRSNSDILRTDIPSKLASQQAGKGRNEFRVANRRIIVRHHMIEERGIGQDRSHSITPDRLHLRDMRRVTSAEHSDRPMCASHCAPKIIH